AALPQLPEKSPAREPTEAAALRGFGERFLDALPLLLGLLLCAAVVAYTLKQFARLLERRVDEASASPLADKTTGGTALAVTKADAAQADKELAQVAARLEK